MIIKQGEKQAIKCTIRGHGIKTINGNEVGVTEIVADALGKYPVSLFTSPEEQDVLHFGQTMWLNLIPEKQKRDTDGEMPWHWFWGFDSIAEAPHNSPTLSKTAPTPHAREVRIIPGPNPTPDKDRDIRRAVALKAAVEYCKGETETDGVLRVAEEFEQWLAR